jgi:hypothetical protein
MKGLMEARKERLAAEKGEPRSKTDGEMKGGKAHHPGKGPDGKPGKPGDKAKRKPALSPKAALSQYETAIAELREARAAATAASPEEAAKAKKDVQAAQRAMRRAQRDIRAAHRADAMKILKMKPDERKQLEGKLHSRSKALAADRKERAQKRQNELKKELGEKVKLAPVRAELEIHAWRVARLERLAAIAEAAGNTEAASRAKELLAKEMAAHPLRLKKAATGAKTGATASKVPAAAAAPKAASTPPVTAKPAALPPKEAAQ